MCYICKSSHGHEIGCPFRDKEEREYKCIECGKMICQEDAFTIFSSGKCLCEKCAREEH